ncbi:MAG: class I tRNA ligase family protein, partial [bacterium]|nr:class I tRNA ligase family protein [bacterium]
FVLWKGSKVGEPSWESPWGLGRPGWHIECSVMAKQILGGHIDIHAGGMDLLFPHHENERAQSEVLSEGGPYVKYWSHIAFLTMNEAKMSKSAGNFLTANELLKKHSSSELRFYLQSAHYRKPLNFSEELLESSSNGFRRLQNTVIALKSAWDSLANHDFQSNVDLARYERRFIDSLLDDFNTAEAYGELFDLTKQANTRLNEQSLSKRQAQDIVSTLMALTKVLGVTLTVEKTLDEEVEALMVQRQLARELKNYLLADEIRKKLFDLGVVIEDTAQGVRWKKA